MFLYCTGGHLAVEVQTQTNISQIGSVFQIFFVT
jgi:hypothetical protein